MKQPLVADVAPILAEAIQTLGSVPSGHLYAQVMGYLSLETYQAVLTRLTQQNRITVSNHLITWKG